MIRRYQHGDHRAIAEIFPLAIHEIASEVYSAEQCDAWSEKNPNPQHWEERCEKKQPFVYVENEEVAGFIELDPDGHIDCMYVHPNHKRKGIASALIDQAVQIAFTSGVRRVFVEASICAKPVFENKGFRVIEEKEVTIRGVNLTNYNMELERQNNNRSCRAEGRSSD
jgi:putative acetyltransferase